MPALVLAGSAVAGCGSSPTLSTLKVSSKVVSIGGGPASAQVAQGSAADVQMTITNVGSSSVQGVTLRIQVPSGFTYTNTVSVTENGDAVRSSDVAPVSREAVTTWGAWTIGPSASGLPSQVVVVAQFQATGASGKAELVPQVFATGYSSSLVGSQLQLEVTPAPSLHLTLRVTPGSVKSGGTVTYVATVTNTGDGPATGTTLSITLPSDFDYVVTNSTSGNASTGGATYPIAGSVIPNWVGFEIPGQGSGGPGVLSLSFQVRVLPDVGPGVYQASATVVAGTGSSTENELQSDYTGLAPVQVTGP